MDRLVTLTAALSWLSLPPLLLRLRRALQGTSLSVAWHALAIGWLAWGLAAGITRFAGLPAGSADLIWYSVAVVMLVPPIAVLGARRPIHRVWPGFVLAPLLLVFSWPMLSAFWHGRIPATWNIEEPIVLGYALVLVMGAGNYIGLRYTLPALLWIAALALVIGSLCPTTARFLPPASTCRILATLLLAAAAWIVALRARHSPTPALPPQGGEGAKSPMAPPGKSFPAPPLVGEGPGMEGRTSPDFQSRPHSLTPFQLNLLWLAFTHAFGIVWARRVQERFNATMLHQQCPLRLGIHGIESTTPAGSTSLAELSAADLATVESSLRWLLQKFVDPEWIDRRLKGDVNSSSQS